MPYFPVRHRDNGLQIKEYVDKITNMMKNQHVHLREKNLFWNDEHYLNDPMLPENIMTFVNVDLFTQNDDYEEDCIDRVHFHVPFFLKSAYINYYIQAALVNIYFADANEGFEAIQIASCKVCFNFMDSINASYSIDIQSINVSAGRDDAMSYWMGEIFECREPENNQPEPNKGIKVLMEDFREHPSIQSVLESMLPNVEFFYDVNGSEDNITHQPMDTTQDETVSQEEPYNFVPQSPPPLENELRNGQEVHWSDDGTYWYLRDEVIGLNLVPSGIPFQQRVQTPHTHSFSPEEPGAPTRSTYSRISNNTSQIEFITAVHSLDDEFNDAFDDDVDDFFVQTTPREVYRLNPRIDECPVCYDTKDVGNYYACEHGICGSCFINWSEHAHSTCPMCRASFP